MSQPTCQWLPSTASSGRQVKFIINTGNQAVTVTGDARDPVSYTVQQGPTIIIFRRFEQPGSYTWTVTSDQGSASATITVV